MEQGWRYPTSLEYESIDDVFNRSDSVDTDRHYVSGERLDGAADYTDDELGRKVESLPIEHEFDNEGILVSVRPVKKKVLGTLREIEGRAEQCALCIVVVAASKLPRQSEHGSNELLDSDECIIRFDYVGQGNGGLVPSLYKKTRRSSTGAMSARCKSGRRRSISIRSVVYRRWLGLEAESMTYKSTSVCSRSGSASVSSRTSDAGLRTGRQV